MDERVKPFMHKLVYVCPNTFIKGRNIMDGVMSLHEIDRCRGLRDRSYVKVDAFLLTPSPRSLLELWFAPVKPDG